MLVDVTSVSAVDFVSYLILNVLMLSAMSFSLVFGSLCGYQGYLRLVRYLYPETQSNLTDYAFKLLSSLIDAEKTESTPEKTQSNVDDGDHNSEEDDRNSDDEEVTKINIDLENMVDKLTTLFGTTRDATTGKDVNLKRRIIE